MTLLESWGVSTMFLLYLMEEVNFDPKTKACVFLGYLLGQKGYKVLEIDTRKIIVSGHVHSYEDKYPFASNSILTHPNPIFSNDSSEDVIFPTYTSENYSPVLSLPTPSTDYLPQHHSST